MGLNLVQALFSESVVTHFDDVTKNEAPAWAPCQNDKIVPGIM